MAAVDGDSFGIVAGVASAGVTSASLAAILVGSALEIVEGVSWATGAALSRGLHPTKNHALKAVTARKHGLIRMPDSSSIARRYRSVRPGRSLYWALAMESGVRRLHHMAWRTLLRALQSCRTSL